MKPSLDKQVLEAALWLLFGLLMFVTNLTLGVRGRTWWLELGVLALLGVAWGVADLLRRRRTR